jgi:hypothetical protein
MTTIVTLSYKHQLYVSVFTALGRSATEYDYNRDFVRQR